MSDPFNQEFKVPRSIVGGGNISKADKILGQIEDISELLDLRTIIDATDKKAEITRELAGLSSDRQFGYINTSPEFSELRELSISTRNEVEESMSMLLDAEPSDKLRDTKVNGGLDLSFRSAESQRRFIKIESFGIFCIEASYRAIMPNQPRSIDKGSVTYHSDADNLRIGQAVIVEIDPEFTEDEFNRLNAVGRLDSVGLARGVAELREQSLSLQAICRAAGLVNKQN